MRPLDKTGDSRWTICSDDGLAGANNDFVDIRSVVERLAGSRYDVDPFNHATAPDVTNSNPLRKTRLLLSDTEE